MADTTGAFDLSGFLRREDHHGLDMHRMGIVLPYSDSIAPGYPQQGRVGEGDRVAAEDHRHTVAGAYIRGDSVAGANDTQFPDQVFEGQDVILKGTIIGTLDPLGNTLNRWLAIRFQDDWYGVRLSLDTTISNNNTYTSIGPEEV